MPRRKQRPIQASELSAYLYCARAWWYRRQGYEPENQAQLASGWAAHRAHQARVQRALLLQWLGWLLLALAIIGGAVYAALLLVS